MSTTTFYTVDRARMLTENQTIICQTNLAPHKHYHTTGFQTEEEIIQEILLEYPEGISRHGVQYLIQNFLIKYSQPNRVGPLPITDSTTMTEMILEQMRLRFFSHLPSRMQSMFAWQLQEEAEQFNEEQGGNNPIFEVEASNYFIADQNWLGWGPTLPTNILSAKKYWRGELTRAPKQEAVILLPATIGRQIN